MSLPVIAVLTLAVLALGYRVYGRFVARQFAPERLSRRRRR